ncbi:3-methyl-2-oxobutanoate hydroxymethyltransferase [Malassezia sp. CBS 17886]|nr:3-methyl-2-oxobutanoate hydroxymethyltransferase [Malassezia sp. CBS 17886]
MSLIRAARAVSASAHAAQFSTAACLASAWPSSGGPVPGGAALSSPRPPVTQADVQRQRDSGEPIVCITAYDAPTGFAARGAGADICLVGDSLANVALGYASTRELSLDAMIQHVQAVQRAVSAPELAFYENVPAAPLVVADMPFGTCAVSVEDAVRHVVRIVHETQAAAVKIEGSQEAVPIVERLTHVGISVMGHIGLQPQRFGDASAFRVQGTTAASAMRIWETAQALERAGCFSIVIECIPAKLASYMSSRLRIASIGIGAGPETHGQVLVGSDIVSDLTSPAHLAAALVPADGAPPPPVPAALPASWPSGPKFVRSFSAPYSVGAMRLAAYRQFADAVRERTFPDLQTESYRIKTAEWNEFLRLAGDH